jgi:hypothetical protein
MSVAEHPVELSVPQLLQEVIIGGAFASAQRNLPADAMSLVALLPLSTITHVSELEVKVSTLILIFVSPCIFTRHTPTQTTPQGTGGDIFNNSVFNDPTFNIILIYSQFILHMATYHTTFEVVYLI